MLCHVGGVEVSLLLVDHHFLPYDWSPRLSSPLLLFTDACPSVRLRVQEIALYVSVEDVSSRRDSRVSL